MKKLIMRQFLNDSRTDREGGIPAENKAHFVMETHTRTSSGRGSKKNRVSRTVLLAQRRSNKGSCRRYNAMRNVSCSGHFQFLRRIVRGLDPVQRLKARENAAGSENPNKYAVSFTETFFPLK